MGLAWIKLHRQAIYSRVFSDDFMWRLWCWCLMRANWKSRWKDGCEIKPGQFTTGRNQAAEQLNVSPSKWYRGMQKLQEWGQIRMEVNSRFTTVTICNWDTYQSDIGAERTAGEQRVNSEWTAGEQTVNTLKEGKEIKEGKEDSTGDAAASRAKRFVFDGEDRELADWMLARIRDVVPGATCGSLDAWANQIRLMRERDSRTLQEIRELFEWANNDSFWSTNILSPKKLREKWTALAAKRGRFTRPRQSTEDFVARITGRSQRDG